jgi:Mg-chelatase subunit ChlD
VKCFFISYGKANTPLGKSIKEEIQTLALAIKKNKIKFEIYDTRKGIDPSPSYIEMLSELLDTQIYRA